MDYAAALAYLDEHSNYEKSGRINSPTTERIGRLLGAMGDPQLSCPSIHITGTNGKGSTAQMLTRLLMAHGLTVGTYSSPHITRINERMTVDCEPIGDDEFADSVGAVADLEIVMGVRPTFFEAVTATAFRWFADIAVDVMVIEVGLLGRWDATNVVEPEVCVVTNVGLDHAEYAGPTLADIAREKAGIVKSNATLVLGETDPDLAAIFAAAGPARVVRRDIDFGLNSNETALGGRLIDVYTPYAVYGDLFVSLHGAHQGENAAVAIAAVEAFFDAPITPDVAAEGLGATRMPGRFEVLGHQPLVIIDGAHNPHGADRCAEVFFSDFDPAGRRLLVFGCLEGRNVENLLSALRADEFDAVFCCTAPTPRGVPAVVVAAAARAIGCETVHTYETILDACSAALRTADSDDAILVAGSLYVVGDARAILRRLIP